MVAKKNDRDGDAVTVVTRALRRSTPELRFQLLELVVGAMIDAGTDWSSLMWWSGELDHAVSEYLRMLDRTNRAVCGHCFENLSDDLKRKLEGKIEVAVR